MRYPQRVADGLLVLGMTVMVTGYNLAAFFESVKSIGVSVAWFGFGVMLVGVVRLWRSLA